MLKKRLFIALSIAPALIAGSLDAAHAAERVFVIINAQNDSLDRNEDVKAILRRIYLKEITSWPSGDRAIFFGRPADSEEEQAFRAAILGMSDDALEEHWTRMKQIRGETPPRAISSTRILLRQIESKKNAVGVISDEDFSKLIADSDDHRIIETIDISEVFAHGQ